MAKYFMRAITSPPPPLLVSRRNSPKSWHLRLSPLPVTSQPFPKQRAETPPWINSRGGGAGAERESESGARGQQSQIKTQQGREAFQEATAMGEEPEKRLQHFYASRVFLAGGRERRVAETFSAVESLVDSIVKWAYQSSSGLYPQSPVSVGSYREGLHLQPEGSPAGFDFLVPVRFNPKLALVSGGLAKPPSRYERRLPTYMFHDRGVPVCRRGTKILVDLEAAEEAHVEVHCHHKKAWLEDDDLDLEELDEYKESLKHHNLDPVQTLKDFHRYVEIALDPAYSHPLQNDPVFQRRFRPPKVPTITPWMRQDTQLEALRPAVQLSFLAGPEAVPVKLVPAIQGALKLSNQWLREDLTHLSDWWAGDLANEKRSFLRKVAVLQEVGPDLVAKGGFWRLSFSNAEAALLKDVDADGGQRRAALRLLKFVSSTRWRPEYGKLLSSYHLKTLLLWCCEIYPQEAPWETLLSSVQHLLKILIHTLAKGNLPHYFLRPVNLFSKGYKSGPTIYGPLALQALRHEAEAMLADVVGYLLPDGQPGVRGVGEGPEKMVALQQFKEKHREDLKELKRMEEEHMYEEVEVGGGKGLES
ncbi:PREDICTED: uncharacterized protein LOC107117610 [Gekko japonicus]|uniref:Uncharacterized protein LOC107117610 n=1 Tax=Gekko japonicus TaxID=146911 RepID=A0ABM1KNF6_GEKJA|nr:PREDICTED: uncharacterized protein LOC107117610 [Gekko japonicus]